MKSIVIGNGISKEKFDVTAIDSSQAEGLLNELKGLKSKPFSLFPADSQRE